MQIHILIRQIKAGIVTGSLFVFAFFLVSPALWAKDCFVYFGTFTDTSSRGIYVSRLDMDSGELSTPKLAVAVESPNFLAISPDGHFLFAATRGDNQPGTIVSFAIDGKTGELRRLDAKSSGGEGPCYVGDDAIDDSLLAANYSSGSVKSFHLN